MLLAACAGVIAATTVRTLPETAGHRVPRAQALWVYQASTAAQMAQDVEAVVLARHRAVRPGRTVLSSRGEAPLAFELNEFVVVRAFKGMSTGERFTLERVATQQLRHSVPFDADGGAYARGQQYFLFLGSQPNTGFYILVNDQARYALGVDGRLQGIRHDAAAAVSKQITGRRLEELPAILGLETVTIR
jgi:hypothetical protein